MLELVHIPKTGGTALHNGLDRVLHRNGHAYRLERIEPGKAVTIVRDPVARFISAWDFQWRGKTPRQAVLDRWPTADAFALALRDDPMAADTMHGILGYLFEPMTWWLRDADYARSRCYYIAHTETLDDDFDELKRRLGLGDDYRLPPPGHAHRNEHVRRSVLSPEAEAAVREHYAADYELLEAL